LKKVTVADVKKDDKSAPADKPAEPAADLVKIQF